TSERSRCRDRDHNPVQIRRIENDGVEAHTAGTGLPPGGGGVCAQASELRPVVAAVGGLEEGGILCAREDGVGVGERGFEVPDALELPGVGSSVVPLVCSGDALVLELGADGVPGLASVVGALDLLAEPAGGLRGVDAVRISGRALEVVDFPAGEVRTGDLPVLAFAVGG